MVVVCLESSFELEWQVRRSLLQLVRVWRSKDITKFAIVCRNHFESGVTQVRMLMDIELYENVKRFKICC